jgi:antitoxin (DNA-binding transcriptional repressor) of toxin-antitoxin stability system
VRRGWFNPEARGVSSFCRALSFLHPSKPRCDARPKPRLKGPCERQRPRRQDSAFKTLDLVEDGEEIVIQRHGRPVARLVLVRKRRRVALGGMRGQFKMAQGAGSDRSPMKKPKRSGAGAESPHLLDTSKLLWALSSPQNSVTSTFVPSSTRLRSAGISMYPSA